MIEPARPDPASTRRFRKWLRRAVLLPVAVVVLLALAWALLSRDLPELQPWHTEAPRGELRAADIRDTFTLAQYLTREDEVMRDVRDRIEPRTPDPFKTANNRYFSGSPSNARHLPTDWNRTFEVAPETIRGGALLLHGMSDGPYSMRAVARVLQAAGFYALALRLPGHGTVPSGLAQADWHDWTAAVRMGARHVRQRIGEGRPLVIVGYSNGGALAVLYTLEALEQPSLPRPDRLVLLSPMIGVSRFAVLSPVISLFSGVPYFNRAAWTSVQPEYNPFKYNSFPANGGYQSHLVTRELDRAMTRAGARLADFPPVLTFQSIVDSTVETGAVVDRLHDRLPANGSALAMFDLNRLSAAREFMGGEVEGLFKRLFGGTARRYRVSVVTNAAPDRADVVEKDVEPGTTTTRDRPLALAWPRFVFSLSHVAVPFPVDDPLYGLTPDSAENYGIRLGEIEPRGERGVLLMSMDDLMRLKCNPFFPYLQERLQAWVAN
jgi:alpha-beta hydrolase superfamily lysophospholipase